MTRHVHYRFDDTGPWKPGRVLTFDIPEHFIDPVLRVLAYRAVNTTDVFIYNMIKGVDVYY